MTFLRYRYRLRKP